MLRLDVLAALALLSAAPLNAQTAVCAKPDTPACAIAAGPFATDKAADDCRKDMLRYRGVMDVYAMCLSKTSADEEKVAREAYEDIRLRFNKRARGETN